MLLPSNQKQESFQRGKLRFFDYKGIMATERNVEGSVYQVILRSRGFEITIDSEDDLELSLDLLEDLTSVLHLNKHTITVAPIKADKSSEDYRVVREVHKDTSQADMIEAALNKLGRPSTSSEIAEVALKSLGFVTRSENPSALIRQVLRKYPRFKQLDRKTWTLTEGFSTPAEEVDASQTDAATLFGRDALFPRD